MTFGTKALLSRNALCYKVYTFSIMLCLKFETNIAHIIGYLFRRTLPLNMSAQYGVQAR